MKKSRVTVGAVFVVSVLLAGAFIWMYLGTEPPKIETKTIYEDRGEIWAEVNTYPFNEAVQKADLIAEITIVEELKELDDPSPKTVFNAKVLNVLKGSKDLQDIQVMQMGNHAWAFNDNKLFEPNESYILFLKKAVGKEFEGTNTYWILGEETYTYTVLDEKMVMKNADPLEELQDIENGEMTKKVNESKKVTLQTNLKSKHEIELSKEVQILEKEKFINKIKVLANK